MEWLKSLLEVKRLPLRLVVPLWFASTFLLFAPPAWVARTHLAALAAQYGIIIGCISLLATGYLASEAFIGIKDLVSARTQARRAIAKARADIEHLDPKEVAVLREFFIQAQGTLHLPIDHPVVAGLLNKGILHRVGSFLEQRSVGILASVQLTGAVRDLVTPALLGLPAGRPTEAQLEAIRRSRPDFIRELESLNALFSGIL